MISLALGNVGRCLYIYMDGGLSCDARFFERCGRVTSEYDFNGVVSWILNSDGSPTRLCQLFVIARLGFDSVG